MIRLPLLGALLEASGMIFEKKILKHKRIDYKNYTAYGFLAIVILMLPMLYFTWGVESAAFELKNVLIFFFVVLFSVLANLFIFYSLKRENLTEFEPIWLMQPLFVVVLAFIFFKSERNLVVIVLALLASVSLILSHVKKYHLEFDKYIIAALLGSFFFAVELVASRFILEHYSPFSFYFLRSFFIFFITFIIFRPSFNIIKKSKTGWMILSVSFIWIFYRVIVYYGYLNLGVIFTTLLFMVSPVLIFLFAMIFLKEKPTFRQIVSTLVILACVILAVLLG